MMETERLTIRQFTTEDAEAMHPLFCDAEAMRLVGMCPAFTDLPQTVERLERWSKSETRLAIVHRDSGQVIGYLAVNPDSEEDREDTRELGFALRADYRGQGYMQEAIKAVLQELRRQNIVYVWACCFTENTASEKLIQALHFTFQQQGTYDAPNDRTYDSLEYRITL